MTSSTVTVYVVDEQWPLLHWPIVLHNYIFWGSY